ncbi:MAG: hypothetical protein H0U62_10795, partial [Actinobacteria bacterium]|nr:hypothetical protein [Actinomycetota bacterium]
TWLTRGTRLEPFLHGDEPAGTDRDYLSVLQGWTRSATQALPEDAATLFGFLCCLEEDDRERQIIQAVWPHLWQRLDRPGDPPDLDVALVPLVEQALVATETDGGTGQPVRFRIHPGVADTGRTSTALDFAAAVDTAVVDFWLANLDHARQNEHEQELGWLLLRAARSAAPYLLHQHRWTELATATEQVLHRDQSTATAAVLLPMLTAALEATRGTDQELAVGHSHACALVILNPDQAETLFRHLLDTAVTREQFGTASIFTNDLIRLYRRSGRLDEALALADTMAEYTRRAGYGPWTQLVDQTARLQILYLQGHYQQVLDTVEELRDQMGALPDPPNPADSTITPFNVRETTLNLGALAARDLKLWQQALDLNTENLDSMRRRGASEAVQAAAAFNDYGPLLELGRPAEARDLLIRCRGVFEANNDIRALGKTLSALATVEDTLGHRDRATDLGTDALRFSYLAADPDAGGSHHNLADFLQRAGGDPQQIWAHHLAAAVIAYQTGSGFLARCLWTLARLLATEPAPAPGSFTQVCQIVNQIPGVHLADLLARLPQRVPDGQTAMDHVLRFAAEAGAEHNKQLITGWDPVLSALHTAISHPDPATRDAATDTLNQALTALEQDPYWQALVAVLRRIHAGDRDSTLTDGLDPVDTAITRRALDLLAGTITIDPDAWHTLTTDAGTDDQGNHDEDLDAFAAAVAAAVTGDTHAQGMVGPVLDEMVTDPDWAPLVAVLRRILDGDHTLATPDELGPAQVAVLDAVRAHLNPPQPTATP